MVRNSPRLAEAATWFSDSRWKPQSHPSTCSPASVTMGYPHHFLLLFTPESQPIQNTGRRGGCYSQGHKASTGNSLFYADITE